jgi:16S rRNA processing protein RimM
MIYQSKILLGQITKTSGFEGAVIVRLEKNFIENIPQMESVFLEIEGRPVPFFIASSEYTGSDILRLHFDGYESLKKVEEFKGCRVFLTIEYEGQPEKEDFSLINGYSVLNQNKVLLGTIDDVIENSGQLLLSISSPVGKEILIPLHEDFIIRIDKRKKIIFMDIPEGLSDLN